MATLTDLRQIPESLAWVSIECWRQIRVRLGAVGMISFALILLAVVLALWSWNLSRHALILEQRLLETPSSVTSADVSPVQHHTKSLETFYAFLPQEGRMPDTVAALIRLGAEENLKLERGEYQAHDDAHAGVVRYRIVLPVVGDAAAIQRFVLLALQEHRTLSLESLAFTRQRIESRQVESRIRLVLIARKAEGQAGASPQAPERS